MVLAVQDTHPRLLNVNAIVPIQLPACGTEDDAARFIDKETRNRKKEMASSN
jgi:hypothetical protein